MAAKSTFTFLALDKVTPALQNIDKSIKGFEQSFNNVKKAVAGYIAFDKIKDFGVESVKAFGQAEAAVLRLDAQLRTSSNNVGLSITHLKNLADDLELSSGIDGDQLLANMSLLQTFSNVTGDIFERAMVSATDLTGVFGSTELAVKQLGDALNDPINGLGKLDKAQINFTENEKALYKSLVQTGRLQEAQVLILEKVEAKYEEVGELLNSGVNGSISRFGKVWGDTMEAAGESIYGAFRGPFEWLTQQLADLSASMSATNILNKISDPKSLTALGTLSGSAVAFGSSSSYRNKDQYDQRLNSLGQQITAQERNQGVEYEEALAAAQLQRNEALDRFQANLLQGNAAESQEAEFQIAVADKLITQLQQVLRVKNQILERDKKSAEQSAALAAQNAAQSGPQTSTTTIPDFLKPYQNPNSGSLVTTDYQGETDDMQAALELGRELLDNNDSMADSVARLNSYLLEGGDAWSLLGEGIAKSASELAKWAEEVSPVTDALQALFGTLANIEKTNSEARIQRLRDEFTEWQAIEEEKIAIARAGGADTTSQELAYLHEKREKEKELKEAERAEKKKAWEADKQAKFLSAVMGTAQGVAAALPNLVLAGVVGTIGAAQIALIASQQAPKFALGGIVPGSAFSGDRVSAQLNSGEMVLNDLQQARLFALANGNGRGSGPSIQVTVQVNGDIIGDTSDQLATHIHRRIRALTTEGRLSA